MRGNRCWWWWRRGPLLWGGEAGCGCIQSFGTFVLSAGGFALLLFCFVLFEFYILLLRQSIKRNQSYQKVRKFIDTFLFCDPPGVNRNLSLNPRILQTQSLLPIRMQLKIWSISISNQIIDCFNDWKARILSKVTANEFFMSPKISRTLSFGPLESAPH